MGGVEVPRDLKCFEGAGGDTGYGSRERAPLRDVAGGWRRHIGGTNGGGGALESVSEEGREGKGAGGIYGKERRTSCAEHSAGHVQRSRATGMPR